MSPQRPFLRILRNNIWESAVSAVDLVQNLISGTTKQTENSRIPYQSMWRDSWTPELPVRRPYSNYTNGCSRTKVELSIALVIAMPDKQCPTFLGAQTRHCFDSNNNFRICLARSMNVSESLLSSTATNGRLMSWVKVYMQFVASEFNWVMAEKFRSRKRASFLSMNGKCKSKPIWPVGGIPEKICFCQSEKQHMRKKIKENKDRFPCNFCKLVTFRNVLRWKYFGTSRNYLLWRTVCRIT